MLSFKKDVILEILKNYNNKKIYIFFKNFLLFRLEIMKEKYLQKH